jgi:hypothetical protein
VWAVVLVFLHWKKFSREFRKQARQYHLFAVLGILFIMMSIAFFIFPPPFIYFGFIFILFPLLFVFAKAVEESCLVVSVPPRKLTEGDWLYEDVYVNGKKIKATWDGVSKHQLELIRKKYRRNILVKQGIPFTPGFLFGFLIILGVWNWSIV